jgi:hypothetical protein
LSEIKVQYPVLFGSKCGDDTSRRDQLNLMALAVIKRQRVCFISLRNGHREHSG